MEDRVGKEMEEEEEDGGGLVGWRETDKGSEEEWGVTGGVDLMTEVSSSLCLSNLSIFSS